MKVEVLSGNSNCKVYHFRKSVKKQNESFQWKRDSEFNESPISELWEEIALQFSAVVEIASFRSYELYITKGKAYEWDEFEPALQSFLCASFNEKMDGEICGPLSFSHFEEIINEEESHAKHV
jgi:hypothetical protein